MPQTGGAINRPKPKKVKPSPSSGAKPASSRPRASRTSTLPAMGKKKGLPAKKAIKYLTKSSGTTPKEVKGLLRQGGTKGAAIKALKGGPKAGVPAGNKKKVAKAIRVYRKSR